MRLTLAALVLFGSVAFAGSPYQRDAFPHLVRACERMKEGQSLLDYSYASPPGAKKQKLARRAREKFQQAEREARAGLGFADATLAAGLQELQQKAQAKGQAAAVAQAAAKKKKQKKQPAAGAGGDRPPQATPPSSYGVVACSRINARRAAIGAPSLCRRGITRGGGRR